MFGTLVIVLPSEHEGGDLILKHRQQKSVFCSSHSTNKTKISFMCWYSDVQHEVTPVTSGYRWVLTYNLAIASAQSAPKSIPTATALVNSLPTLFPALVHWLAEATDEARQKAVLVAAADKADAEAEALESADRMATLGTFLPIKQARRGVPFTIRRKMLANCATRQSAAQTVALVCCAALTTNTLKPPCR